MKEREDPGIKGGICKQSDVMLGGLVNSRIGEIGLPFSGPGANTFISCARGGVITLGANTNSIW